MFKSTKLKGLGELQGTLTSDTEMQNLESVQLVFRLASVHYFLNIPFYGMVMYIPCHCVVEGCDLLFDFDFTVGYS